jgi:hypothetical protein
MSFRTWLLFLCATTLACSEPSDSPAAVAMSEGLTSACIGDVSNDEVWIYGPGSRSAGRSFGAPSRVDQGVMSRDGSIVLGWNSSDGLFALVVESLQIVPFRRAQLSSSEFDLSSDGSKIIWVGRDTVTEQTGLLRLDVSSQEVQLVASAAKHPSMSPDGSAVAYEDGSYIKIYTRTGPSTKLTFEGSFPSWSNDGKEVAYRTPKGAYRIINIQSELSRDLFPKGDALGPLQWSRNGRMMMYVTRRWQDFWLASLSCTERFSVIVHEVESSNAVVLHTGCRLHPERTHWINSAAICNR